MATKVVLYLRVSTDRQDVESQRDKLVEFCKSKGYELAGEYKDILSGTKAERPEFKRMLDDASRGLFNMILIWELSRFSREGAAECWAYLKRLRDAGVSLFSYSEPIINTTDPLVGDVVFTIYASLAKAEREKIVERTNKTLDTIRKHLTEQGFHRSKAGNIILRFGRPKILDKLQIPESRLIELRASGMSVRRMAQELHIKRSTLQNYLKGLSNKGVPN